MALFILVVLWIVLGVIAAALSPRIFKRPAPFGTTAEYPICVVTAVVVGFLDRWALSLPMFRFQPPLPFIVMLTEPFVAALLVLWILRQVKRSTPASQE
jgi:uncharacterized membrane protein YeaQ/YmgE (transglycosylase-associated protein family)